MSRRRKRATGARCCDACRTKSVPDRLTEFKGQLEELASATNARKRNRLLAEASPCLLEAVRTCVVNFLKGRVPLDDRRLAKRLKRHAGSLVDAVRPSSGRRFRERLQQTGGFLPLLLPAIVSLIGGLAGEAIGRATGTKK